MISATEAKIIRFFVENVKKRFSIREISRQINASYMITHRFVQKLVKKNILLKERYGRTDLCLFNYKNLTSEVIYVEALRAEEIKNKALKEKIRRLKQLISISNYTLILSNNKFILVTSIPIKISHKSLTVLDEKTFVRLFDNKEESNTAKDLVNNHIILHGIESYYQMLKELR